MEQRPLDARVTIVGADPAGLATARELARRGVRSVLLERDRVGATWASAYPHLKLHTHRMAAALPGMSYPPATSTFPRADEVHAYLRAYAARFGLDVREGVDVTGAERRGDGWTLHTSAGPWHTRVLVWAGGIWAAPVVPELPGRDGYRGEVLHVRDYRGPEPFRGRRLLVVGAGNSGKDVAVTAVGVAPSVTIAVRGGVLFVPNPGPLTQRSGALWRRLPSIWTEAMMRRVRRPHPEHRLPWPDRPLRDTVAVVGTELVDAVRAGRVAVRPAVSGFSEDGVRFADGSSGALDIAVLATGFRPATDPIAGYLGQGGAPTAPGLFVVGARYPTLEMLREQLRREVRGVAGEVVGALRGV